MTQITYPRSKINSLIKHLEILLTQARQISNQKLYFGILKVHEELTKTKQILGDNHNETKE